MTRTTHIIGVAARKGGAGKTTVAIHLAGALSGRGYVVALVDADLQGSAAHWAELGQLPFPVHALPLETDSQVASWSRQVRDLEADLVVIDSPPHLNAALGGVLGLADLVLVPCAASGLDLLATQETLGVVRDVRGVRHGKPKTLLVPNRVDIRTGSGQMLAETLKQLGEPVAPSLGDRTAFSDSFNAGQWVGVFAASSVAFREADLLALAVLKTINLEKRR